MGCDIHPYIEQIQPDGTYKHIEWSTVEDAWHATGPFNWRNYGMFGFLANVRNYSKIPPISPPRGLPIDVSPEVKQALTDPGYFHNHSWLHIQELLDFDYERVFEDRRCTKQLAPNFWSGTCDSGEGKGVMVSYYDFLGEQFFKDLALMKSLGATRLVFTFDN